MSIISANINYDLNHSHMTIASANINYGYLQNESLGTVSRKSLLNSFASGT